MVKTFVEKEEIPLKRILDHDFAKTSKYDSIDDVRSFNGDVDKEKGLGWFITGLFLVGDVAGAGLVALPAAVTRTQFYFGTIALICMAFVAGFTSTLLGLSWRILLRNFPQYSQQHTRKPYPEIAYQALGNKTKNFVSVTVSVTQFGNSTVLLLLACKTIYSIVLELFGLNISYCYVILIVSAVLLPVTFLKSPQDFWVAVVVAMITTLMAIVFVMIGVGQDYSTCAPHRNMPDFKISNYLTSLGTIIFAYGGHAGFPTIHHDMKKPSEFTTSSIMSFCLCAFMYIPVSVMSYWAYGDSLRGSVIDSIQTPWIQITVNSLIAIHCTLAVIVNINPFNQEMEELFDAPQEFSAKRAIIRSGCLLSVMFVALSIPNFGPLLDFVGAAFQCLNCIILPCVFYIYLNAIEENYLENKISDRKSKIERVGWRRVITQKNRLLFYSCALLIVFGLFVAITASVSALIELTYFQFTTPCYVRPFIKTGEKTLTGITNCCGHFQNISRLPQSYSCAEPSEFY